MLTIIGTTLIGIAMFLGLWANMGKILGKMSAIKQKKLQNKTIDALKDEKIKRLAIEKFKQANEYLASESGKAKMDWAVNSICNAIPGDVLDGVVRQVMQNWYEERRAEMLKP